MGRRGVRGLAWPDFPTTGRHLLRRLAINDESPVFEGVPPGLAEVEV